MPNIDQHLHEHESLVLGFMLPNWLQAMGVTSFQEAIRMCCQMGVNFHNRTDYQHAKKVLSDSPGLT